MSWNMGAAVGTSWKCGAKLDNEEKDLLPYKLQQTKYKTKFVIFL